MRWIFYESPLSGRMLSILRIIAGIIFFFAHFAMLIGITTEFRYYIWMMLSAVLAMAIFSDSVFRLRLF